MTKLAVIIFIIIGVFAVYDDFAQVDTNDRPPVTTGRHK